MRRRENRLRIPIRRVLLILFAGVFLTSAVLLCILKYDDWKSQQLLEELTQQLENTQPQESEDAPEDGPVMLEKFRQLYRQNPDLFGWIVIEGTNLNQPVMYTPWDEDYYLRRNFGKEDSRRGAPFLGADCFEGCGNYILYGHNMGDHSVFSDLIYYYDPDFWQEHPVIRFDTLYEAGEYEVMAAFFSRVFRKDEEKVFRYYNYSDLTDQEVFEEFVQQVHEAQLYDTGVTAQYGDQLLTLITCTLVEDDERLVVVAKRTEP